MSETSENCEVCGFVWDAITPAQISTRINSAAIVFAHLLRDQPEYALVRPREGRWSAIEYGCHVRDVLFNLRDRIILGAVEDNPEPKAMYGTPRIELGLYRTESVVTVAEGLIVAGALFGRTFDALPAGFTERPIFYGWPRPATRTLKWVAAQALHECEHHLDDAKTNISLLMP